MISNKIGTQTFSKGAQHVDFKDEKVNYTPAAKDTEAAGEEKKAVGDILNQIANPGGKDPNKPARRASNNLDKDDFLKLMLTQMKYQDPMNPMQSHEMAAQLAQFTSLEQLFNVNKNLEGLSKAQDPVQKYEALNLLGKTIKADSRQIFHQGGDSKNDLRFNLAADATKLKIAISDETGNTIKLIETGGLKKGGNKITWNGTDKQERELKPGRYFFSVEAENSSGRKVGVLTETKGTITGINYSSEGPLLMVGDQKVRLQDVENIEDGNVKEMQNQLETLMQQQQTLAPQGKVNAYKQQQTKAPPTVMPENKPQAKLDGAVLPLEVASANEINAASQGGNGISSGGAFGRK
ncbi:MAG: flagellar hook assembly protein FlgD [Oligoflexia bacterium]|nr:flagellar hook assembly protein FlgD [Oligoflexia bacterium]